MKIDNYAMELHSYAQESRSVSTTFSDELLVKNKDVDDEFSSIEEEQEFLKRLQHELINRLISLLTPNQSRNSKIEDMNVVEDYDSYKDSISMYRHLTYETTTTRTQSLDVGMSGFVQSGDRKIKLDIDLSFSSTFVESHSIEEATFFDPLVLSFDGAMPELDDVKFEFDIDMDGKSDQISNLESGSGFLALDKNGDGEINDGNELFGTRSGNGFLDLAQYDEDSNNWIDENDAIFDKLRIWSKNETHDELVALGEKGIGALFLGHVKGDFDLMSGSDVLGRIKSNGLFLNEDGTSGLMTQIDLAKHENGTSNTTSPLSDLLKVV